MILPVREKSSTMVRLAYLLLLAVTLFPASGCGAGDMQLRNDLKQVGLEYHNYHDSHQQGPPNWEEFIAFAQGMGAPLDSFQRVRDAGYEFVWGAKFSEMSGGLSNTVMAKPPGPGPKLMFDGSVQD
jgi:hypothetical protein